MTTIKGTWTEANQEQAEGRYYRMGTTLTTTTLIIMQEAKGKTMKTPWKVSTMPISTDDGIVDAGASYKAFESKNFGWLVFGPNTVTNKGVPLSHRIYRF